MYLIKTLMLIKARAHHMDKNIKWLTQVSNRRPKVVNPLSFWHVDPHLESHGVGRLLDYKAKKFTKRSRDRKRFFILF